MACFKPVKAWKYPAGMQGPGGRALVFRDPYDDRFVPINLPCGKCIGCRMDQSRDWALRCMHEASQHSLNSFVTLTYAENPLSLCKRDVQLFLKRLRKAISPLKVRFFLCGEYGSNFQRPHYHLLLFGFRPSDLKVSQKSSSGFSYSSKFLNNLWGKGFVAVGDVTFASAGYTSRYCFKKQVDKTLYSGREPEFVLMSRRPGIGTSWIKKFHGDLFSKGYVTFSSGKKSGSCKFYDDYYRRLDLSGFREFKERRLSYVLAHPEKFGPDSLEAQESLLFEKLKFLKRGIEG